MKRHHSPAITPDGRTLFFASKRPNGTGKATEIWVAQRSAANLPFAAPAPVDELNTTADESPFWISEDGCVLYFQRYSQSDGAHVFEATRLR